MSHTRSVAQDRRMMGSPRQLAHDRRQIGGRLGPGQLNGGSLGDDIDVPMAWKPMPVPAEKLPAVPLYSVAGHGGTNLFGHGDSQSAPAGGAGEAI